MRIGNDVRNRPSSDMPYISSAVHAHMQYIVCEQSACTIGRQWTDLCGMSAYRWHKMFCIHAYLARPVKQVIPRSEVAAGMCAGYIFAMPRKNGHNMRNVCGRGAVQRRTSLGTKPSSRVTWKGWFRIHEFRQFEEKWLWDFAPENWTRNPKES